MILILYTRKTLQNSSKLPIVFNNLKYLKHQNTCAHFLIHGCLYITADEMDNILESFVEGLISFFSFFFE